MEKEDKALLISTVLFTLLILIGVGQSFTGAAVVENGGEIATVSIGSYFSGQVYPTFMKILTSPFEVPEMLWIAIPLILVLLFMQIYFGRWRNEKLGWASAFGNWITLLFVGVNLFKEMMMKYALLPAGPPTIVYLLPAIPLGERFIPLTVLYKFMLVFVLLAISILFMVVLFMHAIPKKASFILSSPTSVYTFAFIMIALVYSDIPLVTSTFIAALMFYILVILFFKIVKFLIPPSGEARKYLLGKEKSRKKEIALIKAIKTRRKHERQEKFRNIFKSFRK